MRLDEQVSKELLESVGISVPAGQMVRSGSEAERAARRVRLPAYIKGLTSQTSRGALGGVMRIDEARQAGRAFDRVTSALSVQAARIEEAVEGGPSYLLSAGIFPGDRHVSLLFSEHGGSGVEGREERVRRSMISGVNGLRPYHVRQLADWSPQGAAHFEAVLATFGKITKLLHDADATLVEINPLGFKDEVEPIALDARVVLDGYADFRRKLPNGETFADSDHLTARLRTLGVDYVQLQGRIGLIGLGAGLTMQIADWVDELGGSPAFFFDATAAAVRDWGNLFEHRFPDNFSSALEDALRLVPKFDVLLANFTSGGTPVDGLARGLIAALRAIGAEVPTVVHVAGNSAAEAHAWLLGEGITPSDTLGNAVRAAVDAEARLERK